MDMNVPGFSLEGKVAIISGSRRGIGKAIAFVFAQAGADVVVSDVVIEDGQLEAVADEIRGIGRRSLTVQLDISQKASVDHLTQRVIDEFGVIDILVNNAGMLVPLTLMEHSEEDWDKVINVNLKGYYLCSQAVGRIMMKQKKGNIVNISSLAALTTLVAAGGGAYSIAKAGVITLTKVLAAELAPYNVRVNAIAPHAIKTELNKFLWDDPETFQQWTARIPLGHWGEPSDIANSALFLASDAARYLTGQTIVASGGRMA
jgi:NAD(P)-dependent dehydrogenase (short-subunit alcohol dehydrogenase family)